MNTASAAPERLVIGILAHVDAGKTTLSEGLLYLGGSIRRMGRVDRRDTFLDTDETERARGITIYAKQALFTSPATGRIYTLMDTPGHADFSAETERTLSILDAAVLLVSAADGVGAQVRLLWDLLSHHKIPVFLFINKMDQAEAIGEAAARREQLLHELRRELDGNILDFTDGTDAAELHEALALTGEDETVLERVMDGGRVSDAEIRAMILARKCFPAVFGSALKMQHVDTLLDILDRFAPAPVFTAGASCEKNVLASRNMMKRSVWARSSIRL